MALTLYPIGTIHTPFAAMEGMPIQPSGAEGIKGTVVLNEDLVEGLLDLSGFSHLILIYFFHRSEGYDLQVTPFLDNSTHGIFATRAPKRPNPIGISVVKLLSITGNVLEIENIDVLDGTPLLDIKPYVPEFDVRINTKTGWLEKTVNKSTNTLSDNRFKK